jgi:glycosyltransferase involved in cell wall biosynthesis
MKRLTIATMADAGAMGQKVYENEIIGRAVSMIGLDWAVCQTVVRGVRSPDNGTRRLPSRVFTGRSASLRRAAGRALYLRPGLVHRMDLRLPPAPGPEVVTVHDVVSWRFPDEGIPPHSVHEELAKARAIICPSLFSATEIAATFGVPEPTVVPNGVDERFIKAQPLGRETLAGLGIRPPFVLHTGGCSLRKNLAELASAWALVREKRPDLSLVMTGPPHIRRERLFGGLPGTVITGRLPDDIVPHLMASAAAVVVPSLYEGFGLPALEAMAAGAPVVAANRSSLPEVCGDAAVLVEPRGGDLADALVDVCGGGKDVSARVERGRRRAASFTWDASAGEHARIWEAAL